MIIYIGKKLYLILINRPKPLSAKEMAQKKIVLRRRTEELLYMAKGIMVKQETFEENKDDIGFCSKMKKSRGIDSKRKKLKVEYAPCFSQS